MRDSLVAAYVVGVGVSISLAQTALALLAARWLWRLARGRARPGWPLAWPLAAFVLATLLAATLSASPRESFAETQKLVLLAGIWVLRDALADARAVTRALTLLLAVIGLVAVVGIVQVAFCAELAAWTPVLGRVTTKCHRAHGFYSIYMTLGGVLTIALLATVPGVLASGGRPAWRPAAWLVGLAGLAVTYVRGAWVGFAAGILTLAASLRHGRRALVVGLVAVVIVLLLLPGVRARVRSMVDPSDPTSSERVHMWRSGLAMARDHPLTGVGPRQVGKIYPRYAAPEVTHKHRRALHSTPIQLLVERGVVGLAAWAAVFAAFFARAWALARRLAADADPRHAIVAGALAAVTGFLVAGLTEYNFGDSEVLLAVIFVMSLPLVIESEVARSDIGAG